MSTKPARLGNVGVRRPSVWLAVLVILLIRLGSVVGAQPADELSLEAYRARLKEARELVHQADEALRTDDTEEKPWRMDAVLSPAARETLRRLLPERCTVTTPTSIVTVNNQSIRSALDELFASETPWEMSRRLQALEAQLDIVQRHVSATPEGEAADIRAILAREAFQPIKKTKTPLEYLQAWLVELIDKIFGKLPKDAPSLDDAAKDLWSNQWVQLGLWVFLTLLLCRAGLRFVRRWRQQQAMAEDGARLILGEPVALETSADELLAQARAAAEAGDWRQAVRKVYIALLHDLDKREIVPLNRAWTNREYLNAVRAQALLYPAMRELTDRFDVLWYGQRHGDREDYEQALLRYREAQAALSAA
ncbi:MAG: DUF4129 domain-containing protein [Chloracidobacterium sp.]|nr:DUF4129 domain-containing protein [Chloracidobacterium sp.]MDW8217629.1 DUF4129 domain-containing protein [Acidobacteriota bacterium]